MIPPSANQKRVVQEFLNSAQGWFLGAGDYCLMIPNKFHNYNDSRDINQVAARIFTKLRLIQKYIGIDDDLLREETNHHRPKITFFDAVEFIDSLIDMFVDDPDTVDVINQLIFDCQTKRTTIPSLIANLRVLLKDHDELRERLYRFLEDGDAATALSDDFPVTTRSRI